MSDDTLRQEIWAEWGKLPDSELSPVKTIASKLGVPTSTVAAVVYPADKFGAWSDDQDPMSPLIDDEIRRRALGEDEAS
jgi:hypothetical protein